LAEQERVGNAEFDWSQFDSESYFQHYYGVPHPDDDQVIAHAVDAIKAFFAEAGGVDMVDVGTGPNFIPLFAALPAASSITAWEYAQSNVAWLEAELAKDDMRSQWSHFWRVTREAYGADWPPGDTLPENPMPAMRAKVRVRQGSIYDLPERNWGGATMFFCAESITGRMDEFEQGCAAFARCVRPGGLLAAAFLVRSSGGYIVGDKPFPVLTISAESVQAVFEKHATQVRAELIGIVEREIRSGYAGFIFLTGRAA